MNPETGGYFTSTTLFKTSLLTVALSSINVYEPSKVSYLPNFSQLQAAPATEIEITQIRTPEKKKKTIYLTFDDGPNSGTVKVMNILKTENVSATLFLVGEHVYGSREQREIYDSLLRCGNIELANHSYTHACHNNYREFYSNADTVTKDFKRCADSLRFSNNIVRTPGRNIWRTGTITSTDIKSSTIAADSIKQKGFLALGWDAEWHFTSDQRLVQSDSIMAQQIDSLFAKNATKSKNALVLLAHDRSFLSPADSSSLHNFIKRMKAKKEYDFETVSRYPNISINALPK